MFHRGTSALFTLVGVAMVLVYILQSFYIIPRVVVDISLGYTGLILIAIGEGVMAVCEHLNSLLTPRKEEKKSRSQGTEAAHQR